MLLADLARAVVVSMVVLLPLCASHVTKRPAEAGGEPEALATAVLKSAC